ncbi:hypothetical protein ACVGWV_14045, partial [Enterobacter asburiae]
PPPPGFLLLGLPRLSKITAFGRMRLMFIRQRVELIPLAKEFEPNTTPRYGVRCVLGVLVLSLVLVQTAVWG